MASNSDLSSFGLSNGFVWNASNLIEDTMFDLLAFPLCDYNKYSFEQS